jgi:redox-sensing transcriptional repressor
MDEHSKNRIYSHELASLLNITAVQVRRDIMFIGYSSAQRKGYNIPELIQVISQIIDTQEPLNVAVIGYGNLGKAITTYFIGNRPKLNLVAAFDIDPKKIGLEANNIKCYSIERLREIIANRDISIAILTVPTVAAKEMAKVLIQTGIKGILNFTTVNLNVPEHIYLEEYDMITSLEKVAYFVKNKPENEQ